MADSVILPTIAARNFFSGSFPNGESIMSVPAGLYRTDTNHLPSEGVIGNPYGTLLILKTNESGYSFIIFVGLQGQSGVWSTLSHNWHQTSNA